MRQNILANSRPSRLAAICAFIILTTLNISAQSSQRKTEPQPTPQAKPSPTLESRFFRNILRDQRAIWTFPFRAGRDDMKWLVPLGLSAATLAATDRYTAGELAEGGDHSTRQRVSKDISYGGSFYATGGIAATFYLIGR